MFEIRQVFRVDQGVSERRNVVLYNVFCCGQIASDDRGQIVSDDCSQVASDDRGQIASDDC